MRTPGYMRSPRVRAVEEAVGDTLEPWPRANPAFAGLHPGLWLCHPACAGFKALFVVSVNPLRMRGWLYRSPG